MFINYFLYVSGKKKIIKVDNKLSAAQTKQGVGSQTSLNEFTNGANKEPIHPIDPKNIKTVVLIFTSNNSAVNIVSVLNPALIISRAIRQKHALEIKNHLMLAFSLSSGRTAT